MQNEIENGGNEREEVESVSVSMDTNSRADLISDKPLNVTPQINLQAKIRKTEEIKTNFLEPGKGLTIVNELTQIREDSSEDEG